MSYSMLGTILCFALIGHSFAFDIYTIRQVRPELFAVEEEYVNVGWVFLPNFMCEITLCRSINTCMRLCKGLGELCAKDVHVDKETKTCQIGLITGPSPLFSSGSLTVYVSSKSNDEHGVLAPGKQLVLSAYYDNAIFKASIVKKSRLQVHHH